MRKQNFTILLVEDSEDDLLLIKRAFKKLQTTNPVHAVPGGNEAIAYLQGKGIYADRKRYAYPSFIITDLKMALGDGMGVLAHLKENPDWAIIPTAVFSASRDLDDIKSCYRLGASSYHIKPVAQADLEKLIQTLYEYWCQCEVPAVDETGKQIETDSVGKLSHRYREPRNPGS
jgi:CheY-like chemotaxis protein